MWSYATEAEQVAGANRRWRCQFRPALRDGSRRESAVAQLWIVRRPRVMKISARDIQVFVAGALALLGTRALLQLPSYFFGPVHDAAWHDLLFYSLSAALDLLLGLAMFFGRRWAILLTQIWLWLTLALSIVTAVRAAVVSGTAKALSYHLLWTVLSDLVIFIALLLLIHLSRSKRFQVDRTPNTALEPTPTAP